MPLNFRRLNHICINVPPGEHKKVREFYGDMLGLKEVKPPIEIATNFDVIWYALGDMLLQIVLTGCYVQFPRHYMENGIHVPANHLAIEVRNIHEFRKELESKKADTSDDIPIAGRDRFFVIDPFGNFIE